jgi:hypothetical protein
MKDAIKAIIGNLFKIKSIITIMLIATACLLAVRQNTVIPSEAFVAILSSVVTYYFCKQEKHEEDKNGKNS